MLHHLRVGIAAAALCVTSAGYAQTAPVPVITPAPAVEVSVARPTEVTTGSMLPSNTEVFLALDSELTSKKAKKGDKIGFKVARDVMLGNVVVIPRGTPASGIITFRTGKGVFGKSAKMEFDIQTLNLGGRDVGLSGSHRIAGDGNTGATVGAVVAAGVIGGLLVTGRSAVAAAGTEFKASTKEPIQIALAN